MEKFAAEKRYYNSSKNWWKYDPKRYALLAIGENEDVLDVGCSYGDFGRRLKSNNCNVDGVEIYKDAIIEAKAILDNVYELDLNNPSTINELISKQYSVITFMDVLEHCIDPAAVLAAFREKLTDGGRVYISLPNIVNIKDRLSIFAGSFDYKEYGVMDKTHLRFFTKKTAIELVSSSLRDVVIVKCTPLYNFLHPIVDFWPEIFALQFVIEGKK